MAHKPGLGAKGARKISKVMREFKTGRLTSSSGAKVRKRKQAIAIALSKAREAGARIPTKKSANRPKGKTAGKKKTSAATQRTRAARR